MKGKRKVRTIVDEKGKERVLIEMEKEDKRGEKWMWEILEKRRRNNNEASAATEGTGRDDMTAS